MEKNIINYYNHYEEDGRLFRNYSHQVEWLTTMYYFDRVLPLHSRIFDGCAGTGNYAFELARRGNAVIASDIVPRNVDIMRQKQMQKPLLDDIFVGDICEMNPYEDHSFDVVLCMGAFYHLDEKARNMALEQCLRLLKKNGVLVISYINFMAALQLNLNAKLENMGDVLKFYSTRGENDPFTYLLPEEIEKTAHDHQLKILHHLTSDGTAYMRGEQLNNLTKESFDQYMKLHLETCEYKYILGYGLHGLIILTA